MHCLQCECIQRLYYMLQLAAAKFKNTVYCSFACCAQYSSIVFISKPFTCAAPPIDIGLSKPSTPQDVDFAVTYPSRVDSQGNHLSYTLRGTSRHGHSKRDTTEHDEALYFRVDAFGKGFVLNVSTNSEFVSENMAVEYVGHNGSRLQQPADGFEHCYHTGHVMDAGGKSEGWVAISNCRGLVSSS